MGTVLDHLSDTGSYGMIPPDGVKFSKIEDYSFRVILEDNIRGSEDESIISIVNIFHRSEANDIDTAKTTAAYV
ncbi:MAG: hypothetical protein MJZ03_05300 [archaeon]|nr:hypothetical protein [archaeon]